MAAGATFPQPLWSWLQNRNMTSTVCHLTPAHYISMGDFECLASETVHCGSDSQQQHEILPHTHYRGLQLSKNTGAKGEQHIMQQGDRDQTCPLSGKTFLQVRGLNSNSAQLEGPKIFLCFQRAYRAHFSWITEGDRGPHTQRELLSRLNTIRVGLFHFTMTMVTASKLFARLGPGQRCVGRDIPVASLLK